MTHEEVVRAYAIAAVANDNAALEELRHPDWTVDWPQSGERVLGSANFASITGNYPGGSPQQRPGRIVGSGDRWVLSPSNTMVRVVGEGEAWWGEWQVTYPDGSEWFCVDLIQLREGKVFRETVYWAAPLPTPEWRAQWVERIEGGQK
ncbi:MAG: hypothetical protein M3O87_07790 [Candidatus Dormibacteraeota bacterium]|nr:hypothetical protein [Candidatus Dormibacteraeota bacterium]